MIGHPAILRGVEAKTVVPALPVPARHRADGAVHPFGVEGVWTGVLNGRANAPVGVACGRVPIGQRVRRRVALCNRRHLISRQHPCDDAGPVDLAVEQH